MFKVGDKVKASSIATKYTDVKPGNIYKILYIEENEIWLENHNEVICGKDYYGKGSHYKYPMIEFTLLKKEIKTELDWLNSVQENFKEGV